MGGANAQDPQGWKRPWGLWGVGLRLKEQKGPRRASHPWSQRAGDLTWEPSRLPGLKWAGHTPSSPLLFLRSGAWEGPSRLPLLISWASFLCPQDQCGWGWGKGGPWRAGDWPGSSIGSLCPSGWVSCPLLLSCSSQRPPPTCLS